MDMKGFIEGMAEVRGIWKGEWYQSFVWRRNYVSNTWSKREEKRMVTFRMGENKAEIDLVLTKKEY